MQHIVNDDGTQGVNIMQVVTTECFTLKMRSFDYSNDTFDHD